MDKPTRFLLGTLSGFLLSFVGRVPIAFVGAHLGYSGGVFVPVIAAVTGYLHARGMPFRSGRVVLAPALPAFVGGVFGTVGEHVGEAIGIALVYGAFWRVWCPPRAPTWSEPHFVPPKGERAASTREPPAP